MASTLTAKYIMGGLASMVGLSGSIYFIVKQSKNTKTDVTVTASPEEKEGQNIDIFDILSKTFGLSLKNVEEILKMLQLFEKDGHQLTMTQIEKHKDKISMLTQLMKQCKDFKEQHPSEPIKKVCQMDKNDKNVIEKLLENYQAIKDLADKYKKSGKNMATLEAAETIMTVSKLSSSDQKNQMAISFFKNLQTKISAGTTTADADAIAALTSLSAFYTTQKAATPSVTPNP